MSDYENKYHFKFALPVNLPVTPVNYWNINANPLKITNLRGNRDNRLRIISHK